MKRGDITAGLVLAGVAVFVLQQARTLSYVDEFGPGPGFLPYWLGLLLLALSACLIVVGFRRSPAIKAEAAAGEPSRALLAWLGLVATAAAMEVIGFISSFALLSFFLVYMIERRSLWSAIAVVAAITLSFFLLFRVILPVPLPVSPWGF